MPHQGDHNRMGREGGREGGGRNLLNNTLTPQGAEMNFFKFNPTFLGVILHIVTILV